MIKHIISVGVLGGVLVTGNAMSSEIPIINGSWKSIACELRPQQNADGSVGQWWLTRDITFENESIQAKFTTYTDAGCQQALQVLSFAGSVEVVKESSVIPGAYDAILTIDDYVRFTPLAEGFAGFLNSAGKGNCGTESWAVGVTQDVLETGCTVLGLPAGEPTVEYEVLGVFSDHLYFAARPVDGSFMTSPEKRVHALQVPLARK